MIDTTLIDALKVLADKERKIKEYRRRVRIKGKLIAKGKTKKGNITLKIEKDGEEHSFTVIKSHKERFALAEKLRIGRSVSIEGIPKFRMIICTKLKALDKGMVKGEQAKLGNFEKIEPASDDKVLKELDVIYENHKKKYGNRKMSDSELKKLLL